MSVTVFDLDDLCDEFDPWEELHALKAKFPGLRVTLFAIPGRCSDDLLSRYRMLDWVELGAHGYWHASAECLVWGYDETREKLAELEELGWDKLFKAPGWVANERVYDALMDEGWNVADNIEQCDKWGKADVPRYVYNASPDVVSIHGHTWDTCGNGPSAWKEMFAAVGEGADFQFVSEVCGPTPVKTYLWAVLEEMALEKGDVFLDCGAFDGEEIEVLQPMGVKVVSYEAHPKHCLKLEERWAGVEGIEIRGQAIAGSSGMTRIYESDAFDSGSSIMPDKMALSGRSFEVEKVDLADVVWEVMPRFVKLDIEGAEWEALESLLKRGVPDCVEAIYVEDHANRVPELSRLKAKVLGMADDVELRTWI